MFPAREVAAISQEFIRYPHGGRRITGSACLSCPPTHGISRARGRLAEGADAGPPDSPLPSVSDKAWEFNRRRSCRVLFQLDKGALESGKNQTNFTPAISLITGFAGVSAHDRQEGLENVYRRVGRACEATRARARRPRPQVFAKSPSPAVTGHCRARGHRRQAVYKTLWKKYGVTGAGGQIQWKGKVSGSQPLGLRRPV